MEQVDRNDKEHVEGSHDMVAIMINGKGYGIYNEEAFVVELKAIAGIHPADKLNEVVHGVLVPVPDDGRVKVNGGEIFASQPCDGKSS